MCYTNHKKLSHIHWSLYNANIQKMGFHTNGWIQIAFLLLIKCGGLDKLIDIDVFFCTKSMQRKVEWNLIKKLAQIERKVFVKLWKMQEKIKKQNIRLFLNKIVLSYGICWFNSFF